MKKPATLIDVDDNYCADFTRADSYQKRIQAAARFCAERHLIYIRRYKGKEKPWTKDPIFRFGRFTNVYREIDKVTEWILQNWLLPHKDSPNIGLYAVLGRIINFPDTLQRLLDAGFNFEKKPNSDRVFDIFRGIKAEGKQLVTGVYIVNTIFPKTHRKIDGTKGDYLANFLIPGLWDSKRTIQEGLNSGSFRTLLESMKSVHGIGGFLANQAAVDLTYFHPRMVGAEDIDSTWNPGPGTTKGIRYITDDWSLKANTEDMNAALSKYLVDLNEALSKHPKFVKDYSKVHTHLVPVSGPDASNTLCELSKYVWLQSGWRDRMKNLYEGS